MKKRSKHNYNNKIVLFITFAIDLILFLLINYYLVEHYRGNLLTNYVKILVLCVLILSIFIYKLLEKVYDYFYYKDSNNSRKPSVLDSVFYDDNYYEEYGSEESESEEMPRLNESDKKEIAYDNQALIDKESKRVDVKQLDYKNPSDPNI